MANVISDWFLIKPQVEKQYAFRYNNHKSNISDIINVWTENDHSNNPCDVILMSQMAVIEVVLNVGDMVNIIYGS